MQEVDDDAKGCWGHPHAGQGSRTAKTRTGHAGLGSDRGGSGAWPGTEEARWCIAGALCPRRRPASLRS